MQQRQGKYIAFFLFCLFVFPRIEKEVHALIHANDEHCKETGEFHFHKKEHSCSICDYSNSISKSPELTNYRIFLTAHSTSYQLYTAQIRLTKPDYQVPLRAPPIA